MNNFITKQSFLSMAMVWLMTTALSFTSLVVNAQCTPESQMISGKVFNESNLEGVADVMVTIYDQDGLQVASLVTQSDGIYSFGDLQDGRKYKLVFNNTTALTPASVQGDQASSVQFVQAPSCEVDYGLMSAPKGCDLSTPLALTCFVHGETTENSNMPTIVGTNYGFNEGSSKDMWANHGETGSIWGLAWKNSTKNLFSAAFVKQFSGLKAGPYAIFNTDVSGRQTTLYTDLRNYNLNLSSLSVTDINDCAYGSQVGRVGLGNMVLSADETKIYVSVLDDNQIIAISSVSPDPTTSTIYNVPAPTGMPTGEEYRIFALEEYKGDIYVGVTITGSRSKKAGISEAVVMKLNTVDGSFSEVFRTNYIKGYWQDQFPNSKNTEHWFTDIDFTDEGNMLISLSDRIGHRYCRASGVSRLDEQKPDLLMVGFDADKGTYTLESNGSVAGLTGTGVGNGQGPDGGEFFGMDNFPDDPIYHSEVALGSVTVMPGTGSVVAAVYDPLYNTYSGGIHRYSTSDGTLLGAMELYTDNYNIAFGKASGFGDLVTLCGKETVEVGNYVWVDADADGIQDAGEEPLRDAIVNLYDTQCNLIASTTTDENGNYLFGNVLTETDYYISVGSNFYDADSGLFDLTKNNLYKYTNASATNGAEDSNTTNAVSCIGVPVIPVNVNSNNLTFDIGFTESTDFDLALMKEVVGDSYVKRGDKVTFKISLYNQGGIAAKNIGVVDYIPSGFSFTAEENRNWTLEGRKAYYMYEEVLEVGDHVDIEITLVATGESYDDFVNNAEIYVAEDTTGTVRDDIDSTPDATLGNDAGGAVDTNTDNQLDGDGVNDEDDEDPATVNIFDLALKIENVGGIKYFAGDKVEFDITVYNQGQVAASSFTIGNYVPPGLFFYVEDNPDWKFTGTTYQLTDEEVLEPGLFRTYRVVFQVGKYYTGEELVNVAEILASYPEGSDESMDYDSTPDAERTNDVGGVPMSSTDNVVLAETAIDEDDQDPVLIKSCYYDLALMKKAVDNTLKLGEDAKFVITVTNQGSAPVEGFTLVDYIPEGLELNDDSWTLEGGMAKKYIDMDGLLRSGESHEEVITLKVVNAEGVKLVNYAEIVSFVNNDETYTDGDVDSQPDDSNNNDNGGEVGTSTDDTIDSIPSVDEDDHDPAALVVSSFDVETECLNNATTTEDGEFEDTFTLVSVSGSTWTVDNAQTYEIGGSSPIGMTMTETSISSGLSEYTFTATRVEGAAAFIRFRNEVDDIEEFETSGSSYANIAIQGNLGICDPDVETYTLVNAVGSEEYTWTLPDGGSFVGGSTGSSVEIDWTSVAPDGVYKIQVEGDGCSVPVEVEVSTALSAEQMLCYGHKNLSLNEFCERVVVPEDMYAGSDDASNFSIMLIDENGNLIPNATLTEEHLGQEIEAKVIRGCGTNTCWGIITVEDKIAPEILCEDIEIQCNKLSEYEGPFASDNCSGVIVEMLTENEPEALYCDDQYTRRITRRYVAVDDYGNQSDVCEVTINLLRIDADDIEFPEDRTMLSGSPLDCDNYATEENGDIAVSETGVPFYLDTPMFPQFENVLCNTSVGYFDTEISDINGVRKVIRTWVVNESHCDPNSMIMHEQNIDIVDVTPPVITSCPEDITVTAAGSQCEATLTLPLPEAMDVCSEEIEISISSDFGFIADGEDRTITLPYSEVPHEITYRVTDEASLSTECTVLVTVVDEIAPVVVCDSDPTVTLSNGEAYFSADNLNDGTYDNCMMDRIMIARMDSAPNGVLDHTDFATRIMVDCDDVGEVMVVLRGYDKAGNFNDCMVPLRVDDKQPPTLTVPNDMTIECGEDIYPLSQFGDAEYFDICGATLTVDSIINLENCGLGKITRIFTVTDGVNSVTDRQVIDIINSDPFDPNTIVWPTRLDTLGQCKASLLQPEHLPYEHAYPRWESDECDDVGYSYTDEIYTYDLSGTQDNCFTILRNWTVRDWCQMNNPSYEPATYQQMIKVFNNDAPTITHDDLGSLVTLDCDTQVVNFEAQANDDCTPVEGLTWEMKVDYFRDGYTEDSYDLEFNGAGGNININRELPLGDHIVAFSFTDACGNQETILDEFTIETKKAPTASCWNMVVALTPMDTDGDGVLDTEMACIFADSLGNKSTHECDIPFELSFREDAIVKKDFVDCDDLGFITRTIYAIDIYGNVSECEVEIEVQDNNDVDICVDLEDCVACPDDIDEDAGADCNYDVIGDLFDVEVVSEECGDLTITHDYPAANGDNTTLDGVELELGTYTITWTVMDDRGRTLECLQNVTITDNESPDVFCAEDGTYIVNGTQGDECVYTHTGDALDATADDNCSVVSITHDYPISGGDNTTLDGAVFTEAVTVITWTAEDAAGNINTCQVTVTLDDSTNPDIDCPEDISYNASADGTVNCSYTVSGTALDATASDNCAGVVTLSNDYNDSASLDGASFDVGTTVVTWTATDADGNSNSCTVSVTVNDDTAPIISNCQDAISVTDSEDGEDCQHVGTADFDIMATDECTPSGVTITNSYNNSSTLVGAVFPIGSTTVIWTVSDGVSTETCESVITVTDNGDPEIECANDGSFEINSMDSDGNCLYTHVGNSLDPTADDECSADLQITHSYPNAPSNETLDGATFADGFTTITWTVTDASGNTATCTTTITVVDEGNPTVTCPEDATFNADEDGTADCSYTVTGSSLDAIGMDGCSDDVTVTHDYDSGNNTTLDGAVFPVGTWTVTWTATDASGNMASCPFEVEVVDNVDPTLVNCATEDYTFGDSEDGTEDCAYTADDAMDVTAVDNCPDAEITITNNITGTSTLEGATFPIGTTTVIWTVSDGVNEVTCEYDVVVTDDIGPECVDQGPFTVTIPAEGTISIDSTILTTLYTEECGTVTYEFSNNTFDCDDEGTTQTANYTISDGTNSIDCTVDISIASTMPECMAIDTTLYLDMNGSVSIDTSEILNTNISNCGDVPTISLSENLMFDCNDRGENVIEITLSLGEQTENCSATITVLDTIGPFFEGCPENLSFTCTEFNDLYNQDTEQLFEDNPFTYVIGGCPSTPDNPFNVELDTVIFLNECGYGQITRTVTVMDLQNNVMDICSQVITIENSNPITQEFIDGLNLPDSVVIVGCAVMADLEPSEDNGQILGSDFADFIPCVNISIDYEDEHPNMMCQDTFDRVWTIVDSCQLDPNDEIAGVFQYRQTFINTDNTPPSLSLTFDAEFENTEGCDQEFDLSNVVTVEDCNNVVVTYELNDADPVVGDDASGNLLLGDNNIVYTATDGCGNSTTDSISVYVKPTTANYTCTKLFVEFDNPDSLEVMASDHFQWNDSTCVNLEDYSVAFSLDILDTINTYFCADNDLDTSYFLKIFYKGEFLDSCKTLLSISDPNNFCNEGFVNIDGEVTYGIEGPISGLNVKLDGSEFSDIYTDEEGYFSFKNVNSTGNYELSVYSDENHSNGVSVIDLIMVQRHILGVDLLDDAYQVLAADVNDDQQVDPIDLLELKRLILRLDDRFRNNMSWKGIHNSITFIDPINPWMDAWSYDYPISNFDQNIYESFQAVKIGDVSHSAMLFGESSENIIRFNKTLKVTQVDRGLDITIEESNEIYGLQLDVNLSGSKIMDISSQYFSDDEISFNHVGGENYVILLHKSDLVSIEENDVLFTLELANVEGNVELSLRDRTSDNMIIENLEGGNSSIRFIDEENQDVQADFSASQNVPNPWVEHTNINLYIPQASDLTTVVRNIEGKVIYTNTTYMNAGEHVLTLDNNIIPQNGVYHVELINGKKVQYIKMIKLK